MHRAKRGSGDGVGVAGHEADVFKESKRKQNKKIKTKKKKQDKKGKRRKRRRDTIEEDVVVGEGGLELNGEESHEVGGLSSESCSKRYLHPIQNNINKIYKYKSKRIKEIKENNKVHLVQVSSTT